MRSVDSAIGERRFSYHAPRVWNSFPMTVRSADSLASFKTRLKTHLFVGSVLWNEIPQLLKNPMSKYTFKRKLKAHLLNEQAIF